MCSRSLPVRLWATPKETSPLRRLLRRFPQALPTLLECSLRQAMAALLRCLIFFCHSGICQSKQQRRSTNRRRPLRSVFCSNLISAALLLLARTAADHGYPPGQEAPAKSCSRALVSRLLLRLPTPPGARQARHLAAQIRLN